MHDTALCVPIRGQLHETKGNWGLFADTFPGRVYVADNLPEPDGETEPFLRRLLGRRLRYDHLPALDLIGQLNHLLNVADHEVLCFAHNDAYLYGDWAGKVCEAFTWGDTQGGRGPIYHPDREHLRWERPRKTGFVVALGSRGTLPNGGRLDIVSNMLEAEVHGRRITQPVYVSHGDGFFMAFRRRALLEVGGFDARYLRFHGYDRDTSLSLLAAGWSGVCAPISCHHRSGLTACHPEYQDWVNRERGVESGGDKLDHDENLCRIFNEKWAGRLPVMVDGATGEFEDGGPLGKVRW